MPVVRAKQLRLLADLFSAGWSRSWLESKRPLLCRKILVGCSWLVCIICIKIWSVSGPAAGLVLRLLGLRCSRLCRI
jgi:hypothetical protein